jgi:hypothetical protein
MRRPAEIAIGLALTKALDRLGGARRPVPAVRASSPPRSAVKRRPLLVFMLTSLAIGVVLMLVFHAPLTRIVGVTALFAFIVSGVFLIADPAFLGPDDDLPSVPGRERG